MSIISDISKRILIVRGAKEVERIKDINKGIHSIEVTEWENDIYKVEINYSVGDYFKK